MILGRTTITVHVAPHALQAKRSSALPEDEVVARSITRRFDHAVRRWHSRHFEYFVKSLR